MARKTRAIALGRGPSFGLDQQKREYQVNQRVKCGELVWSRWANLDRFGARGDFVTPEKAAELEEKAARGVLWGQQVDSLRRPHGSLFARSAS